MTTRGFAGRIWRWWHAQAGGSFRRARVPLLLMLVPVVLGLGTWGFLAMKKPDYDVADALYRSVTLFGFGGAVEQRLPLQLNVARFVAPLITGYAAVGAILLLFRDRARGVAVWACFSDHVIVAGLGAGGIRLARALSRAGIPTVVIDREPAADRVRDARDRGLVVLTGDATAAGVLRRAGLGRARALITLCGQDSINVDVVETADLELRRRPTRLPTFVQVDDLSIWQVLSADVAQFHRFPKFRLELFNVHAFAARLVVERHPPFVTRDRAPVHVLMVGLDGVGEQLVLQLVRSWHTAGGAGADPLRLTLAGQGADDAASRLRERYPAIAELCRLGTREADIRSDWFQHGAAMLGDDGRCDVTHAYVCQHDPTAALSAALALHAAPSAAAVPVVVALDDEETGLAAVLAGTTGRFAGIHPFGILTSALSPRLLESGANELIAEAKHREYVAHELARGRTVDDNPLLVAWADLPDEYKESNREFADSVGASLKDSGAVLVPMPLPDPRVPASELSAERVEQLAEAEHERWMTARQRAGWRLGPRDEAARTHPDLRPWAELDDQTREKDRNPMRELPRMLAPLGFTVHWSPRDHQQS